MGLLKIARNDITFQAFTEGLWAGTRIAEVFSTTGTTRMSSGIHEMGPVDTVVDKAPVDDVLYILEGSITIEADGKVATYQAGDFAYLFAGARQHYTVTEHVKLVYICYPRNWKLEE